MKQYEKSGVSLTQANELSTKLNQILSIKAFSEATELTKDVNLVTCCDGIGSKIIPLIQTGLYKTIAIDTVSANLNDLVCSGATAVAFLDYIAVNKLENEKIFKIIEEISNELETCNCKLLGGETSELKDLITTDNIDISGFAIGLVNNQDKLPKNVTSKDIVIGLCSSGIHANGFSLIRKLFQEKLLNEKEFISTLEPTYNYYNCVKNLIDKKLVKACANITGGGIFSNLNRIIPSNLFAELDFEKIPPQPIFEKLKTLCDDEFYQVFNAGVGFCIITEEKNSEEIFGICQEFSPFILGKIRESK